MKIVDDHDFFSFPPSLSKPAPDKTGQFERRSILNNLITLGVDVARGSSNLSLIERRLMSIAISRIDSRVGAGANTRQKIEGITLDERTVVVSVEDYAEVTGNRRESPKNLQLATDNILSKQLHIYYEDTTVKINYLSSVRYYADSGEVELIFNDDFFPLITNLGSKNRFIKYKCRDIQNLNIHAMNLLELLKTYPANSLIKITNIELRRALNAVEKYKTAKDLRVQVIEPALAELNAKGWTIKYAATKQGRRVIGYQFSYSIERSST